MTLLEIILGIALLVLAVGISVLVMLQKSKEGNLSGAIAGGSDNFLGGSKGSDKDKFLSVLTAIFSAIFAVLVVVMYIIVG